ncbi:MAG: hypothetical protein JNM65_09665 [Verrucomicrobiaceae bacterium]|nr:hypothetical protein [Verrucomicrobiaceae bacterium]
MRPKLASSVAVMLLSLLVATTSSGRAEMVCTGVGGLQVGFAPATGSVQELIHGGFNQVADNPASPGLSQLLVLSGETSQELSAEHAGTPTSVRSGADAEIPASRHPAASAAAWEPSTCASLP